MTDDQLWASWICRPVPPDGEDDSMESQIVGYARAVLARANAWIAVDERMPPDREFVLVKCPSGYTTTPFVYTTARRDQEYRPGRWIDHANDGLTDWGMEPTHWRALP